MEQEKYCSDGISDGPDVPLLIQSPSLTLKATYNAFEYSILGTGQGARFFFFFFFNDSSGNSNGMFVKFGKTGLPGILLSSSQLLLTPAFCRTHKLHLPLISNPSTTPQGKALVSSLHRWGNGLRGFQQLALSRKAHLKQNWEWNCLSGAWWLLFHRLLQDLAARMPYSIVWPQKREPLSKMAPFFTEKTRHKLSFIYCVELEKVYI